MRMRWIVLLALTLSQAAMGLQFQSVPALAGPLAERTGLDFAGLGALRDAAGAAAAPLLAGAAMLALCIPLWARFRALKARGSG
ncbi:MAG: hypothetical protein VYD87_06665 [Pseudomonadota bacterium]|nr:hypothetical protein [Pseudomonadota bacterium]MEE3098152.1 hypothetical protein [Pseudomonadota bacterium]